MLEVPARVAQVGERVQVGRVVRRRGRRGRRRDDAAAGGQDQRRGDERGEQARGEGHVGSVCCACAQGQRICSRPS